MDWKQPYQHWSAYFLQNKARSSRTSKVINVPIFYRKENDNEDK